MKTWAYVAGAAAAVSAAAVVVLVLRRPESSAGEQIPRMIADCQNQVERIERELRKLRATPA